MRSRRRLTQKIKNQKKEKQDTRNIMKDSIRDLSIVSWTDSQLNTNACVILSIWSLLKFHNVKNIFNWKDMYKKTKNLPSSYDPVNCINYLVKSGCYQPRGFCFRSSFEIDDLHKLLYTNRGFVFSTSTHAYFAFTTTKNKDAIIALNHGKVKDKKPGLSRFNVSTIEKMTLKEGIVWLE